MPDALAPPLTVPSAPALLAVTHPGGGYAVYTEPLARVPARLAGAGLEPGLALVVTDETVARLHLEALVGPLRAAGWQPDVLTVAPGEGSKSLAVWSALAERALAHAPTRATPVLALGGGVVGDLAGFLAATLLRGLPLVQLPTTVLAQVDSALGGKTGVNAAAGKNLVGAFYAPRFVLADPAVLATLPERELRSGLAEAVKHGLLAGGALYARLLRDADRLGAPDVLPGVVREAAAVKAAVVSADPFETGERAFLNLGHTFAHALERAMGYGRLTHGEAVAHGLRAALHLSASLAAEHALGPHARLPAPFDEPDRLVARLAPLPVPDALTQEDLDAAMGLDKKRDAGGLRFVVLDSVGAPRLASSVPPAFVSAAWAFVRVSR